MKRLHFIMFSLLYLGFSVAVTASDKAKTSYFGNNDKTKEILALLDNRTYRPILAARTNQVPLPMQQVKKNEAPKKREDVVVSFYLPNSFFNTSSLVDGRHPLSE